MSYGGLKYNNYRVEIPTDQHFNGDFWYDYSLNILYQMINSNVQYGLDMVLGEVPKISRTSRHTFYVF